MLAIGDTADEVLLLSKMLPNGKAEVLYVPKNSFGFTINFLQATT